MAMPLEDLMDCDGLVAAVIKEGFQPVGPAFSCGGDANPDG